MEQNNSAYDFDFFCIGAGSGGVRASRIAAKHGARVGICEESRVGGTCVIRGCVPKKLLVYSSHYGHGMHESKNYGWTVGSVEFDWKTLIQNKNTEIDRLNGIYHKLLDGAGVKFFKGHGKLIDEHTIQIGDEKVTSDKILLCTGSWPWMPKIPGIEHVITSNEALDLEELPKRVAIVGGGYIACEFAGIFNGCGSTVYQIYRGDALLRGFDGDVRKAVTDGIINTGVNVVLNTNITKIEKNEDGTYTCTLDQGEPLENIDQILYATGRLPNTANLGLETVGIEVNKKGAVIVDEYSATNVPNIYAVGDLTDRINLTPVALAEGHAVADTLFGNNPRVADHADVPSAVFSEPPVASVGLTEEEAKEKYQNIDVYVSSFTPLKHTITKSGERAFMKLIVDAESDRVIGCHMVGADAAEIIQGLAIAVKCNATKAQFDATIGVHPSAAEEFVTMRTKRA